jgi:hypothetical protein
MFRKGDYMIGIPNTLATRQDWLNTYHYVQNRNTSGLKQEFRSRLTALKDTRYMKVPKADAVPSVPDNAPEGAAPQFQPEDYEDAPDPASPFVKSGLVIDEIDQMIGAL